MNEERKQIDRRSQILDVYERMVDARDYTQVKVKRYTLINDALNVNYYQKARENFNKYKDDKTKTYYYVQMLKQATSKDVEHFKEIQSFYKKDLDNVDLYDIFTNMFNHNNNELIKYIIVDVCNTEDRKNQIVALCSSHENIEVLDYMNRTYPDIVHNNKSLIKYAIMFERYYILNYLFENDFNIDNALQKLFVQAKLPGRSDKDKPSEEVIKWYESCKLFKQLDIEIENKKESKCVKMKI